MDIANKYQKKEEKEHILDNPDTYTGSMDKLDIDLYVYDDNSKKIVKKQVKDAIMGLYKLFDEGIVNCRDHSVRLTIGGETKHKVGNIQVTITDEGMITFYNDGKGIDVVKHPEHDEWIPEMIFYHLRTGTNFNKNEEKIVGGKNGLGAKLLFIWSTFGSIEIVDNERGLKYKQECRDNLDVISKPKVTKCKTKPYTKITFMPDYNRLGLKGLSDDMKSLFKRRVYDIAAVTDKSIKVKYNNELVEVKTFQNYVDLYIGKREETERIYEECVHNDKKWKYIVCLSDSEEFQQVSFVNGIYTKDGGKHVDYVLNQIVKKLQAIILKKRKVTVKSSTIKEQIMLFLDCEIINPSFNSQTKDYMSTPVSKFGSTCVVSDKFCDKIAKLGVLETACQLTNVKENKHAKKTDGNKTKSIRGIPKLMDANFAGTVKSKDCTIILCEGDSAKAGIVSGLSKEDRNYIGIYPMKGKLFNVRGETQKKINENKEIIEIKQILGLESNKEYKTVEEMNKCLRYGYILFMTDQDLDGIHITGLGFNLFHTLWDSLIRLNKIGFMNTPILKARRNNKELVFYNDAEYECWKKENDNGKGWKIKYYKGLGTSTSKEFKEYFKNKKIITFDYTDKCNDHIDMAFNKKRADDRKDWLGKYNRDDRLDNTKETASYTNYIKKNLIHFSKYDNERSIPHLMDGLKISTRKILYSAFKKNLTTEIKVSQFSGYVSEHSNYHHGEMSLNGAIVNLAQDFVGSNNINLFQPNGQFGTRLLGGADSASERYICTKLSNITRDIFSKEDDDILDYLDDDGKLVEPRFYVPAIPMILVNGGKGIGTGFSTDIPCYKKEDLINYLLTKLNGEIAANILAPYYEGFKGTITSIIGEKNKWLVEGVYEKDLKKNKVMIKELPIGVWTTKYKEYLEKLIHDKKIVKDVQDMSTDKIVDITLTFHKGELDKLLKAKGDYGCNKLEKTLKLYTTISTNNMNLFTADDTLKHYHDVGEIIDDFYTVKLDYYNKRKKYQINALTEESNLLDNKVRYINELLNDTLDLRRKNKKAINSLLETKKYLKVEDSYDYLVRMPMYSVCVEEVEKLMNQNKIVKDKLDYMKHISCKDLWKKELLKLNNLK